VRKTSLFKIMGEFKGNTEQIDDTTSHKEADFLAREYRVAFGESWRIWVEEEEEEDEPV